MINEIQEDGQNFDDILAYVCGCMQLTLGHLARSRVTIESNP